MSKKEANQCVLNLLNEIDMLDQKDKYPSEMSGGQQQRIAILRAVACNPKLLFGDEPTGALNSNVGKQVLDLLTKLNENGQSIVMVTHDMKAGVRGNRMIYLSDGRIVGELNLGKYRKEDQKKREEQVFKFLEENNW
jgi:putative ABC transport system ATP-binding protein